MTKEQVQAAVVRQKKVVTDLQKTKQRLERLVEVAEVQKAAEYIEKQGGPELQVKLKPFKEHYGGDVVELLRTRTKQNFEKLVVDDVSKKGQAELAKYRSNPSAYLPADKREEVWNKAYDITIEEAIALGKSLQAAIDASKAAASATQDESKPSDQTPKRRLFGGSKN